MAVYEYMKNSKVTWFRSIPENWALTTISAIYNLRNEKVSDKDYPPLSVTMKGVVPQLESAAKTENGDNRKLAKKGDFVINSRSDRRGSCGISNYDGSVSLINTVITPKGKMHPGYYDWLFHTVAFADEFYKWGHGIVNDLWTTHWQEMKRIIIPVPPFETQVSIATYLNDQCAKIDTLISEAKASIEEYKQWKASLIFEAVTKGLDPNVEMKDSGVDIIGMMPSSWQLIRVRFLCSVMTGNQDTQNAVDDGIYPFYVRSPKVERANVYTYDGEGVLMAGDGAGAGRVFHHAFGKYAIHQRVYCFHDFIGIMPELFCYFMENRFSSEMDKGSAKSTVPSVRLPMLLNFKVCIPPIYEQKKIINYLNVKCDSIDAIINEKITLIDSLDSYKKSLIFETVTGKRKVV